MRKLGELLVEFKGHHDAILNAVFSADGRRVLTASQDETARLWDILPHDQPPPKWFGEFLVSLSGQRLGSDGRLQPISSPADNSWGAPLVAIAAEPGDDDYLRVLRWRMKPASERTISPYANTTRQDAAAELAGRAVRQSDAERVYLLDPTNPHVQLLLATFEKDEIAADFLRRYSLDRLQDDPDLQLRAAEILLRQKETRWALGYVERVLFHRPGDPAALALRARLQTQY